MNWLFISLMAFSFIIISIQADNASPAVYPGFREYKWLDSARDRDMQIAVWYPTHEQPIPIAYGPFQGHAKEGASITPGKHPLVLISHGTGGHRFNQFYLAEYLAAQGYIIVALQHPKNSIGDDSDANLLRNLWNRPKDVSFALDQALKSPELTPYINPNKIGVIGHSLGGYTSLVLVGAKPDIGLVAEFCSSIRGAFTRGFCKPKAKEISAWRKGKFLDFSDLQDPRIGAAFVMAPGVPVLFNKSAMTSVNVPVHIVISGKDEICRGMSRCTVSICLLEPHLLNSPRQDILFISWNAPKKSRKDPRKYVMISVLQEPRYIRCFGNKH